MNIVLELSAAQVAARGVELWASQSARVEGARLGLVGDFSPLFRVLAQDAQVASGRITLDRVPLSDAVAQGVAGLSLCDPPLDRHATVSEYVSLAARLAQCTAREARSRSATVLERFGLAALGGFRLATLNKWQQRVLGFAMATVGEPKVVCLETPFAELDAVSADHMATLLERVAERSALLFSVGELAALGPERSALDRCDQVLVSRAGVVTACALVDRADRYQVSAVGNVPELRAALERAGCRLHDAPADPYDLARTRFVAELPADAGTNLLLDTALEAGATVLELQALPNLEHA
ncbi:MAG TPA: hypothetical protein VGI10_17330 [Polyangiaceae bacterium]|jgi:ABC-type multidrug transport system ATPase subunit